MSFVSSTKTRVYDFYTLPSLPGKLKHMNQCFYSLGQESVTFSPTKLNTGEFGATILKGVKKKAAKFTR